MLSSDAQAFLSLDAAPLVSSNAAPLVSSNAIPRAILARAILAHRAQTPRLAESINPDALPAFKACLESRPDLVAEMLRYCIPFEPRALLSKELHQQALKAEQEFFGTAPCPLPAATRRVAAANRRCFYVFLDGVWEATAGMISALVSSPNLEQVLTCLQDTPYIQETYIFGCLVFLGVGSRILPHHEPVVKQLFLLALQHDHFDMLFWSIAETQDLSASVTQEFRRLLLEVEPAFPVNLTNEEYIAHSLGLTEGPLFPRPAPDEEGKPQPLVHHDCLDRIPPAEELSHESLKDFMQEQLDTATNAKFLADLTTVALQEGLDILSLDWSKCFQALRDERADLYPVVKLLRHHDHLFSLGFVQQIMDDYTEDGCSDRMSVLMLLLCRKIVVPEEEFKDYLRGKLDDSVIEGSSEGLVDYLLG